MSFKTKFKSFFTVDDEYEYIEAPEQEQEFSKETKEPVVQNRKSAENVVNLTAISQSNSKVVLSTSLSELEQPAKNVPAIRTAPIPIVFNLMKLPFFKTNAYNANNKISPAWKNFREILKLCVFRLDGKRKHPYS